MRDLVPPSRSGDVVLGDDWVAPNSTAENEVRANRERRGLFSLKGSPLARRIITFNLIALNVLVAGILYLNSSRDSLALQRASALVSEAELIADVFEAQLPQEAPLDLATNDDFDAAAILGALDLRGGIDVFVFDTTEALIATTEGQGNGALSGRFRPAPGSRTVISDTLTSIWNGVSGVFSSSKVREGDLIENQLRTYLAATLIDGTQVENSVDTEGGTLFSVTTPIVQNGVAIGVIAITSAAGEIDSLVRGERERVLQMFVVATLVSIGLSLVLASTIANPLSDLAAAAELGRDKDARKMNPGRIRIPDLTARPDEIADLAAHCAAWSLHFTTA